jgi:hypothetical protein
MPHLSHSTVLLCLLLASYTLSKPIWGPGPPIAQVTIEVSPNTTQRNATVMTEAEHLEREKSRALMCEVNTPHHTCYTKENQRNPLLNSQRSARFRAENTNPDKGRAAFEAFIKWVCSDNDPKTTDEATSYLETKIEIMGLTRTDYSEHKIPEQEATEEEKEGSERNEAIFLIPTPQILQPERQIIVDTSVEPPRDTSYDEYPTEEAFEYNEDTVLAQERIQAIVEARRKAMPTTC